MTTIYRLQKRLYSFHKDVFTRKLLMGITLFRAVFNNQDN